MPPLKTPNRPIFYEVDALARRLDCHSGNILAALDTLTGISLSHPELDHYYSSVEKIDRMLTALDLSRREVLVWLDEEGEAELARLLGVTVADIRFENVRS